MINIISVGIYTAQGVYAMSVQYAILMFIAANGTREWARTTKRNSDKSLTQATAS